MGVVIGVVTGWGRIEALVGRGWLLKCFVQDYGSEAELKRSSYLVSERGESTGRGDK